jgi:hypothetical protein
MLLFQYIAGCPGIEWKYHFVPVGIWKEGLRFRAPFVRLENIRLIISSQFGFNGRSDLFHGVGLLDIHTRTQPLYFFYTFGL